MTRGLLAADGVELLLEGKSRWFFIRFILSLPFGQRPIEGKSRCASSLGKIDFLFRRRMEPDFVRLDHP